MLKLVAAGAGLFFLPTFALSRVAGAALRTGAPAKRVLILNLSGGVRSSASFFASSQKRYNPYGLLDGAGAAFPLGQLLDDHALGAAPLGDADYTLSAAVGGERLPRFREMARECAVLGSWDSARGDHIRARLNEPTGSADGREPGILTRLAAGLAENGPVDVLPFQVAPQAAFGQAASLGQFSPVSLASPKSLPVKSEDSAAEDQATGNDWAADDAMRERLDQAVIAKRAGNAKALAEIFATHRRASRRIGARLAEPWVNVGSLDASFREAAFGTIQIGGAAQPLTNAMLAEIFAKSAGTDPGGMNQDQAMNGALAVRLLQLGAPAVCVEITGFDLHSQERDQGPPLYAFLGRLWATLSWAMKRIPDPLVPTRSLYDTTLVMTMSDFGRDPGSPSTGFNGGEGSDHGADPSCYWLAHLAMGGGVQANRVVGRVSTDDYRGDIAQEKFGPRDVLAMVLWAIGLDPKSDVWGLADASAPLDALFRS
jgi:hypothetical protein